MNALMLALFAFVGTHLLMSHPLRALLVKVLGEKAFLGVYSLVSFATLGWAAIAYREAPVGRYLWTPSEWVWTAATIIMLLASILLAGSLVGNPALPGATVAGGRQPRGVFAITRHPMMWSFILWAIIHFAVSPRPAVFVVSLAVAALALIGSIGQDAKKLRLQGAPWRDWMGRTAFVPFSGQLSGRIGWGQANPGAIALVGGLVLWLAATWAHPYLGAPIVGAFRWII